jgi:hypothetical protein
MPETSCVAPRTVGVAGFRNLQFFRGIHMSTGTRAIVALALATISSLAIAGPNAVLNTANGRYYEVFASAGISWDDANTAANAATHLGVQGHLATITSGAENTFVTSLFIPLPPPTGTRTLLWVGGRQTPHPCTPEGGCNWTWVFINQPYPGSGVSASPYANWATGQADNSNNSKHMAIAPNGGWDDTKSSEIRGYVVEYGDSLPAVAATACDFNTTSGCDVTGNVSVDGVVIKLPESANVQIGDEYTVAAFLVPEPAGRCGTPWELNLDGDPDSEVIVSGWLCANHDMPVPSIYVFKTASPVEVPSDLVTVTHDTNALLGPTAYECSTTLSKTADDVRQVAMVWQYDDKNQNVESEITAGQYAGGTVTEYTAGCSRGKGGTSTGSYHLVGLHIHATPAVPGAGHQTLVGVFQYKVQVARLAFQKALAAGAIANGDATRADSALNAMSADVTNGNFKELLKHLQTFQRWLGTVPFNETADGINHEGETKMRSDNVAFIANKAASSKP